MRSPTLDYHCLNHMGRTIRQMFRHLCRFAVTVFSKTVTVEAGFSISNHESNAFRRRLTDLILEKILHSNNAVHLEKRGKAVSYIFKLKLVSGPLFASLKEVSNFIQLSNSNWSESRPESNFSDMSKIRAPCTFHSLIKHLKISHT